MSTADVQFVTNDAGETTSVLVPIALWKEMASELETRHLLRHEAMRKRLLEARAEEDGYTLEETIAKVEEAGQTTSASGAAA